MEGHAVGRRCAGITAAVGTASLVVTLALRWSGGVGGSGPTGGWRAGAMVETGLLVVLVAVTARLAPHSPAIVAGSVGGAALTGLWLLRFDAPGVSPVMLVGLAMWAAVAVAAAAAGTYLRSLDRHFARELAAARAAPEPGPDPDPEPQSPARRDDAAPLTARELEIATLVADGRTNAEIAAELFLAPGTIKNHVANIQRKLGARNRVGIAAWLLTSGSSSPRP